MNEARDWVLERLKGSPAYRLPLAFGVARVATFWDEENEVFTDEDAAFCLTDDIVRELEEKGVVRVTRNGENYLVSMV